MNVINFISNEDIPMQYFYKPLSLLLLLFLSLPMFAVDVIQCEDQQGERGFYQQCPPGTVEIARKKLYVGGSSDSNNAVAAKVTLYAVPDCEPCEEVREFLQSRNITFEEKDVSKDLDIQKELEDFVGALKVPTTIIGDEVISGYQRLQMKSALGLNDDAVNKADSVEQADI